MKRQFIVKRQKGGFDFTSMLVGLFIVILIRILINAIQVSKQPTPAPQPTSSPEPNLLIADDYIAKAIIGTNYAYIPMTSENPKLEFKNGFPMNDTMSHYFITKITDEFQTKKSVQMIGCIPEINYKSDPPLITGINISFFNPKDKQSKDQKIKKPSK